MTDLRRELQLASVAVAARAGAVRPRRLQALQRHLRAPGGRRAAGAPRRESRPRDQALRRRLPDRRRRVLRARDDRRVERQDDHRAGGRGAVRAGRGLRDQGLARRRDPAARGARRDPGAADRRPAHVRAQGGPPLLGHPPDARHPAAGPARARARPRRTT